MNQERKSFLKERVETLGRDVKGTSRNLWLAGLGVASSAESEGRKLFDELVAKGEKRQGSLARPWKEAKARARARGEEIEQRVESRMASALERFGVPGRDEVTTLITRIEQLTQKVESLAAAQR